MSTVLEAIYEHGVLRPLGPTNLLENKRYRLVVEEEEKQPGRAPVAAGTVIPETDRQKLAWLDTWRATALTEEEERVLDELEAFREQHPVVLHSLDGDP
jgi:predicted DNA-binding antitoxin AbrB/MazE fold protein